VPYVVKFWKFFSTYKLLKNFLKLFKVFTLLFCVKETSKRAWLHANKIFYITSYEGPIP
jgi:hypothetical protein